MEIEFEATYSNIDKHEIREKLQVLTAQLIKPEFLQKRSVFHLPPGQEIKGGWLRVRDEAGKITLCLKVIDGDQIEDQKEIELEIDNFQQAELLLLKLGCRKKAFQESKREIWLLNNVEIMIDEWPFLEPFIEVEGKSKAEVESISVKLGLDFKNALFCSVDKLYSLKYGISQERINDQTPEIIFNGKNPFL